MNETQITVFTNFLMTTLGVIQIIFLKTQKKHTRIALIEQYRQLWKNSKIDWGFIIYFGRRKGDYYQILDDSNIIDVKTKIKNFKLNTPTIWALNSIQNICGLLSELSTRVLQGHLTVSDVYPILGTEFLRHSKPLRQLLESNYNNFYNKEISSKHCLIRKEMQDWLIYHDGVRRRCLILIDLLWAEAVRLQDLPPEDIKSAAESKKFTGNQNRKRVFKETIRLNGISNFLLALYLSEFLKKSEYRSVFNLKGLDKNRLKKVDKEWTSRILNNQ